MGGGRLVWPVDVAPEPLVSELDLLGAGGGLEAGVGGGRGLGQVQGVDGHVAPVALVHPVISAERERNIMIDSLIVFCIQTLPVVVFKVLKLSVRLGIPDPHW